MEVSYVDPKLEKLLADERALKRAYAANVVKALRVRITSVYTSANLRELHALPGGTRALKGNRAGEFAMDLPGGLRLILRPTEPLPRHEDGGIDLAAVTRITIIEISEHYT